MSGSSESPAPPVAEFPLSQPPTDGISALCFAGSSAPLLVATSWDSSVSLFDTVTNQRLLRYVHNAAVLDAVAPTDQTIYSGGLDNSILEYNVMAKSSKCIGRHASAVRCLGHSSMTNTIFSGSWDKSIKGWDPRQPNPCTFTYQLPERVFTMSIAQQRIVVGMAERKIFIFDVRKLNEPEQQRESALKYQTRVIRCFPDAQGFVVGSIEGRIAVEYFDPSESIQSKRYAFKCHRQMIDGVDTAFPVNALAFHPRFGTFASGGCDGLVNVWDADNKKRLCQYPKYNTSISSLAFNADGSQLAIAVSYTFEQGEKPNRPTDAIVIRNVNEVEVKPKPKVVTAVPGGK